SSDALRIHNEGSHVIFGMGVGLEVRHVIASPLSRRFVPPDLLAINIPGLPRDVARSSIVKHAPVGRPRPRPVWENSHTRRVLRASPLDLRSGLGPRTGINPIAARRSAVVFQPRKPRQLLAGFDHLPRR